MKYQKQPIPNASGIGLRSPHYEEIIKTKPNTNWLEIHPENFFVEGGASLAFLEKIRMDYPLSMHGVGLSLGSTDKPSKKHLKKIKTLIDSFEPGLFSEHLSWSAVNGIFANDLLPIPYTEESLEIIVRNINITQDFLGRVILIENPSSYLEFKESYIPENEFLKEASKKSGCNILLDINNIYVSSKNHKFDANEYISSIPQDKIKEIHLAGYSINKIGEHELIIDTHDNYVSDEVWDLYKYAIETIGRRPTLIEWDQNIPSLQNLIYEAQKAEKIMQTMYNKNFANA